jgi:hypothetical protein
VRFCVKYSPNSIVFRLPRIGLLFLLVLSANWFTCAYAQTETSPFPQPTELQQGPPLTNEEFVRRLYQLAANAGETDKLVNDIRKRGLGFAITPGLRSLVATKSGNDQALLHTLDEAARRRANPTVATPLPPVAETNALLDQARKATLGAAETMPDYLVKQQITRSHAFGQSRNWSPYDRLSIAVSYRQAAGEDYKLLTVNGLPVTVDQNYNMKLGGTISTGEYVSTLTSIFTPESQTEFQAVDTDTLRSRRTIIYEFTVKRENSRQTLGWGEGGSMKAETVSGYKGRIWVDRENYRVLRVESISTEIEPGFPITAASKIIDYDWVTITDHPHLLPSRAVVELTARDRGQTEQTRNEILFRGYRKFSTDVKIIDVDEKDFPPDKPEETPKKPETPPALKPPIKKP